MTNSSHSRHRDSWLRTKLSAALLISLLQRTPALRFVHASVHFVSAPVVAQCLTPTSAY
jgi:hypothetical protein